MIAEVGGTKCKIQCQPDFQDFKEWITPSMLVSKTQGQAPVVQRVDHAIHWTMIFVHWTAIYPIDSATLPLNNLSEGYKVKTAPPNICTF